MTKSSYLNMSMMMNDDADNADDANDHDDDTDYFTCAFSDQSY